MRHAVLNLAFVLFLAPVGDTVAHRVAAEAQPTAASAVEQRILIKHCYGQFRSQDDIARCLARGAA